MADTTSIRGIKIKLEGDASGLLKSLKDVSSELKTTQKYLNDVNKLLNLDPKNVELSGQKFVYLRDSVAKSEEKLALLREAANKLGPVFINGSEEAQTAFSAIQREIEETKIKIKSYNDELAKIELNDSMVYKFGERLETMGSKVEAFGRKFEPYSRLLSGFTTLSISSFADFESAFTGVMKTVDEEYTGEYETLKKSIRDMAQTTASTAEDIAGVMEVAGQLAIPNEDLAEFTKTMIMLGDSTNLVANEGAISLAKFLNITGTSASEIDRLGAAIVDLGNNFATQEQDIVDMSYYLASAGSAAGLSAQEILGLATAMSSAGIKAAAGGSSMMKTLRSLDLGVKALEDWDGFSTLSKEGNLVNNIINKLGVSAEEFGALWKASPIEALKEFIKVLNNTYEEGDSLYVIMQELGITEIRQSNMLRALSISYENFDRAIETANNAYDENTALITEANKRYKTYDSKLSQTKEKIKLLASEMGERLVPFLTKLFEQADKLIEAWDGLSESQQDIIVGAITLGGKISTITKLTSPLITGVGNAAKTVAKFGVDLHGISNIFNGTQTGMSGFGENIGKLGTKIRELTEAGKLDWFTTLSSKISSLIPFSVELPVIAGGIAAIGAAWGAVSIVAKTWSGDGIFKETLESLRNTYPDVKNYREGLDELRLSYEQIQSKTQGEAKGIEFKYSGLEEARKKLEEIVDENGYVKEGYERQAEVIAQRLNLELGTTLKLVNGQLVGYKDIEDELANIIAKKKAESYLGAYADDYAAALKAQAETQKRIADITEDKRVSTEKLNAAQQKQNELIAWAEENGYRGEVVSQIEALDAEIGFFDERLTELQGELDTTSSEWDTYTQTIQRYSDISAAAVNGSTDEINDALLRMKYGFVDSKDASIDTLKQQVEDFRVQYLNMRQAVKDGTHGASKEQEDELFQMYRMAKSQLDGYIKYVTDAYDGLNHDATKWGTEFVNTWANGIKSATDNRANDILKPANLLRSNMHFSIPDEGPLHTADEWAPDFMKLYAEGIKKNAWRVEYEIDRMNREVAVLMGGSSRFGIAMNGGNPSSVVNQYSNTLGGVNIVINAAENQDVYAIADAVNEVLTNQYNRQERAFAQ